MFPVCEECFDILKPDEIDKHIDNLILSWARFGDDLNEQSFESVAENAKLEMRRMKEGKGSDL